MLKEELLALSQLNSKEKNIIITTEDLKNIGVEKNTTLIYGYDINRNTRHVYFMDNFIHVLVYNSQKEIIDYEKSIAIEADKLIPSKRTYPERSLFSFIKLIKEKGLYVSITTFNEKVPKTEIISSNNQKIIKPIFYDKKLVNPPEYYNCAFTFAFEIANCLDPKVHDPNPKIIRQAIIKKINTISDEELIENIGAPFDSFVE